MEVYIDIGKFKRKLKNMAQIIINNVTHVGKNLSVKNTIIGRDNQVNITIDGNNVYSSSNNTPINISVTGDIERLEAGSGDVIVKGNCGSIKTGSGDVEISGDVISQGIQTGSGDVTCGDVHGNIKTGSGDITCTKH